MIPLIEQHTEALRRLCRQYNVVKLELFGSGAREQSNERSRDLDFLVEFASAQELGPWLAHYFAFRDALEALFGRSVDLVMPSAMKSPRFIREVNRTRRLLYAA